jgi:hypothetical protein
MVSKIENYWPYRELNPSHLARKLVTTLTELPLLYQKSLFYKQHPHIIVVVRLISLGERFNKTNKQRSKLYYKYSQFI